MKNFLTILLLLCMKAVIAQSNYLAGIKQEMNKKWPENRTINLVFHGHSVPAGYFKTPDVRTLEAYPHLVLEGLKKMYPNAVINVITTSIGGENSTQGVKRFKSTVLNHQPDVLFIDYALNDRRIGLEQSGKNIRKMIKQALKKKCKVILLTPSPDMSVDWATPGSELDQFAKQLKTIAAETGVELMDSYGKFRELVATGKNIQDYMAQSNHPNKMGHQLIADEIINFFE